MDEYRAEILALRYLLVATFHKLIEKKVLSPGDLGEMLSDLRDAVDQSVAEGPRADEERQAIFSTVADIRRILHV